MVSGNIVRLRPARESDRRDVYSWLACSDVTPSMMGPPTYPDAPVPTWDEFCSDYGPHFFDGSASSREASWMIEVGDEAVGHINYMIGDEPSRYAELDIWMRSERDTGHGWGSEALAAMMEHLLSVHGVATFVIRPSARNARAIGAYKKAGFMPIAMSTEEQARVYGPGDYDDTVVMIREYSVEFRPVFRRWVRHEIVRLAAIVCCAAVGLLIGFALREPDRYYPPMSGGGIAVLVLAGVFGWALGTSLYYGWCRRNFVITVDKEGVTGPKPPLVRYWPGSIRRVVIPLSELDRIRSAERRRRDRILGRQYLRSTTGATIGVPRWTYSEEGLRRLLGLLGLEEESHRKPPVG